MNLLLVRVREFFALESEVVKFIINAGKVFDSFAIVVLEHDEHVLMADVGVDGGLFL